MPDDEQDFDELAADLALDAKESYEVAREEQHALLDDVAKEEGADVLETQATIRENTVPVSGRLNGDLFDRMGELDERVERIERGDARAYEVSETADELAQLLADLIDDPEFTKAGAYNTYRESGIEPLGVILEAVFEALKAEEERRQGAADGFRAT